MTRPALGLVAVVALLAAGTVTVSAVDAPALRAAHEQQVDVVGATAVCPDVRQNPGAYQTRISVGAAPLPAGRTATGGSIRTTLVEGASTSAAVPITAPGQVAVGLGTTTQRNGVAVSATGALATGLEVEQVARGTGGHFRGLASVRCEPPKRDAWFIGASTSIYDTSVLKLANIDDSPATVDISEFGLGGAPDARPGQGLTVGPHSVASLKLDTLSPDLTYQVVHVRSRQGRVVASLSDLRFVPGAPLGFDYVPQALAPQKVVVVPGIPQGPGARFLMVGNPSDDDTTVSLQATLADGQFVPAGMDAIPVPAHRTRVVDLASVVASSSVTITVTSSGAPVVAGGYLVDSQLFQIGDIHEMAFAGSAKPLSGPALLTDLVIDRPTESTLLLSAPDATARVVVTPIKVLGAAGSPPAPRTLTVPGGRTVALRLSTFFPPGTSARLAVEVRPLDGSGPVYASRYLRERGSRGTLTTLLTLQGPAQLVERPAVVQDDEAAYP